jgi:hypothetical protein
VAFDRGERRSTRRAGESTRRIFLAVNLDPSLSSIVL